ncbi:MAG: tol-pal system protein YbgF [Cyclobacteriaceae bacterium]
MSKKLLLIGLIFLTVSASAKSGPDSTQSLLLNQQIQIEATQALNDMYNYKFDKAEMQFRWLKQKYGWHPLPYFLLGLSQWWKIIPDLDNHEHDAEFMAYMDTSLVLSKRLYEEVNEVEGAFFLAATNGFVARLESDRGNWRKAASAGSSALKYVDEVRENLEFSPEVLFGDAIMNYYTEWIRDNYPALRPIMWFFPRGDMEKGLEQLSTVAHNAFYTRTEAQYYLIRILANEEKRYKEAFAITHYLRQTYPDNPYFHRFYLTLLYRMGRFTPLEAESKIVLAKIDSGRTGYEGVSGRYACYYLGRTKESKSEFDSAKYFYNRTVEFATETEDLDAWYAIIANMQLGIIYKREQQNELAKKHLEMVVDNSKGKKSQRNKAKDMLRDLKRSSIKRRKKADNN